MEWKPATVESVEEIVQEDLAKCDPEQNAEFKRQAVKPYPAPILRYGKMETLLVVAGKATRSSIGRMLRRASTFRW